MRDKVLKVMGQVLNVTVERLQDDSSPDTVENWDSLRHMNLILALEEEFATTFSNDEVIGMSSLAKIVEIVAKKTPGGRIASG